MATHTGLAQELKGLVDQGIKADLSSAIEYCRTQFIDLLLSDRSFSEFDDADLQLMMKLGEFLASNISVSTPGPTPNLMPVTLPDPEISPKFSDSEQKLRQILLKRLKAPTPTFEEVLAFWQAPSKLQTILAPMELRTRGFPLMERSHSLATQRRDDLAKALSLAFDNDSTSVLEPLWLNHATGDCQYISESNALEFFRVRSKCLDRLFPHTKSRRLKPNRSRRKVGLILPKFTAHTETYVTLPFFADLDPQRYETFTFIQNPCASVHQEKQSSQSDHLITLPSDITKSVEMLRSYDLDIAVFASNITWAVTPPTLFAHLGIAPIQIATSCCPTTTGISKMDYMLSGSFTEAEDGAQNYTEELLLTDGPAHAFDFVENERPAPLNIRRSQIGLDPDDVVFISGANAFKISREYMVAMIKILKRTPRGKLILYPFNPNWASQYDTDHFIELIEKLCLDHGLDVNRIKILPEAFPDRRGVFGLLKISDIYLDSFFHSGATSVIDPLLMAIPTLTHYGTQARSRQALALLKCLDMEDFAHNSVEAYIEHAVKLGTDAQSRKEVSHALRVKMLNRPKFLDPKWFSRQADKLFQQAIDETLEKQGPKARLPAELKQSIQVEFASARD